MAVELPPDPVVALAPDLALGQVGLGGVDGHDIDVERTPVDQPTLDPNGPVALGRVVAMTERVEEVEVADVLGVVVAGDHDGREPAHAELGEVLLGLTELVGVAVGGEVAADHHQVGVDGDGLLDGRLEQMWVEVRRAAVDVGELGDDERLSGHGGSLGNRAGDHGPRESV